jgi:hypothetical protein
MGRFRKAIAGIVKKIVGSSLKRSRGSSSTCNTEHEESLMHEDEETVLTKEQEQEQVQGQSIEEDDCWHFLALVLRTSLGPVPSNDTRNAMLASPKLRWASLVVIIWLGFFPPLAFYTFRKKHISNVFHLYFI